MKIKSILISFLLSGTAKDSYLVFAGNFITSFLAVIYTIFIARRFSPEQFGVFSSVLSFVLLSADVLDLGISTSLSRFYPELKRKEGDKKANDFIKNTFIFQFLASLTVVILILLLSPWIANLLLNQSGLSGLYLIAGIGVLATVLTSFSTASLSAQKKFLPVVIVNFSSTFIKLFFVLVLFYINKFSLNLVTASFAIAPFASFFIAQRFLDLSIIRFKFRFSLIKKLLSFSVYTGIARVLSAISSRFDSLMLIPLSNAYEAGIYGSAYKIIFTYILMAGSFSMVIAPRLAAFTSLQESLPFIKKVIFAVFAMLGSLVLLYFMAPFIIPIIFGENYVDSISVFQSLLLPTAFFISTIPTVNYLLYVAKKPHVSAFNTFVQFIILFTGNLFFIPRFGRFGPVYTLTIAYGFTFFSSVFFTLYYMKYD